MCKNFSQIELNLIFLNIFQKILKIFNGIQTQSSNEQNNSKDPSSRNLNEISDGEEDSNKGNKHGETNEFSDGEEDSTNENENANTDEISFDAL